MNSEHVTPGRNSGHTFISPEPLSWLFASELSVSVVIGQGVEAVALVAHMSESTAEAMCNFQFSLLCIPSRACKIDLPKQT